jgi:hypothetical protein
MMLLFDTLSLVCITLTDFRGNPTSYALEPRPRVILNCIELVYNVLEFSGSMFMLNVK